MTSFGKRTVLLLLLLLFAHLFDLNGGVSSPSADQFHFWQVTDLHWDRSYSRTGDPNADCRGLNVTEVDNGDYGNSKCDTNTKLYESALRAMSFIEPRPRFILWTGDNAPHVEYPNQTWFDVYDALANVSLLLGRYFPTTTILPVLGNHDTVPSGQFPSNDSEFYAKFLVNGSWSDYITDDDGSRSSFLRGGYYAKDVASNSSLTILVINTCLYLRENRLVDETDVDPSGQFDWMRMQLEEARQRLRKVLITSHVAPGYYATSPPPPPMRTTLHMKATFNDRLIRMLADHSDVIAVALFGHEHVDSFRLISDDDGRFKVVALVAPPVNPWIPAFLWGESAVNPGMRLYVFDDGRGVVDDYHQFYLNYTEANLNASAGTSCLQPTAVAQADRDAIPTAACICTQHDDDDCAEWRLLYRPTIEYGITDLGLNSIVRLYEKLVSSSSTTQTLLDTFTDHLHLDYVISSCDHRCRHGLFCSFVNITESAMNACFS